MRRTLDLPIVQYASACGFTWTRVEVNNAFFCRTVTEGILVGIYYILPLSSRVLFHSCWDLWWVFATLSIQQERGRSSIDVLAAVTPL